MTIEQIQQHMEDNDGFCIVCKEVTNYGGVEPDARNYKCEQCGEMMVFGMEEAAAVMMVVPISVGDGDDYEPADIEPGEFDPE